MGPSSASARAGLRCSDSRHDTLRKEPMLVINKTAALPALPVLKADVAFSPVTSPLHGRTSLLNTRDNFKMSRSDMPLASTAVNERREPAAPVSWAANDDVLEKRTVKRGKYTWPQVIARFLFFLTAAAVLGLAGYIAHGPGSSQLDKVYAVVFAAVCDFSP